MKKNGFWTLIRGSSLIFLKRSVSASTLFFTLAGLSACAGSSTPFQGSQDFSSPDSEFRIDYEEGMLWANSLTNQLIQAAEDAGSEFPRFDGFSSAISQMVDLYGSLEEGCRQVVEYNFGDEFPEGQSRDAWVAGCLAQMELAQETAESIKPK